MSKLSKEELINIFHEAKEKTVNIYDESEVPINLKHTFESTVKELIKQKCPETISENEMKSILNEMEIVKREEIDKITTK